MRILEGIPVSSGIAMGQTFLYKKENLEISTLKISPNQTAEELEKFNVALSKTLVEMQEMVEHVQKNKGEEYSQILSAQLSMASDVLILDSVKDKINTQLQNAESALFDTMNETASLFLQMDDEYFRERSQDIKDVCQRILRNMKGLKDNDLTKIKSPCIIIAEELLPSDTANLNLTFVLGLATQTGGATSHTSIMAKSYGIPAIVGIPNLMNQINHLDDIIVDGSTGKLYLNPSEEIKITFNEQRKKEKNYAVMLENFKNKPCITKDGKILSIYGNIGNLEDADHIFRMGINGIGLFRTEFLYMESSNFPSEEKQFQVYDQLAKLAEKKQVVIRTLDIGGDKELPYHHFEKELNPFLGLRAIRFSFLKEDIFKTQIKAILRASVHRNLSIMLPMIISLEEIRHAKELIEDCKMELKERGLAFDENIPIGIMCETPATVMIADILAKQVDFFSIGSNDLTQYTLAVERGNSQINELYDSFHPSLVRSYLTAIEACHQENKWAGLCGELGSDLKGALLMYALGIDELSMNARAVLQTKHLMSHIENDELKEIQKYVLTCQSGVEIRNYLQTFIDKKLMDIA